LRCFPGLTRRRLIVCRRPADNQLAGRSSAHWSRESPHSQSGVDTTVIALWLGHADVRSTGAYVNSQELHQTGEKLQVA
jgi:hypothetical protein